MTLGQIVILNGAPRSGKSRIAGVIQDTFDGVWMNLGVDNYMRVTPRRYLPGIGLRPGEAEHPVEPLVPVLYAALFESIAAHSRLGLNVVLDVGLHGGNPHGHGLLSDCARRLEGLPVLFVGVRCPIEEIMRRRNEGAAAGVTHYVAGTEDDPVPAPVLRWQTEVHTPGGYDLEVDTSVMSPQDCAEAIRRRLLYGPSGGALASLARQ